MMYTVVYRTHSTVVAVIATQENHVRGSDLPFHEFGVSSARTQSLNPQVPFTPKAGKPKPPPPKKKKSPKPP